MNMQQIMAQAQKMQKDITSKKNQIDNMVFVGKSDWLEVHMSGNHIAKKINIISDEVYNPDNKDILEDMILLAINDAEKQIEKETESKLGAYANAGGLF